MTKPLFISGMPVNRKLGVEKRRLPPISGVNPGSPGSLELRLPSPLISSSVSRYHLNCQGLDGLLSADKIFYKGKRSRRKMTRSSSNGTINKNDLSSSEVVEFLQENPDFLENFVLNYVEQDILQKWVERSAEFSPTAQSKTVGLDVGREQLPFKKFHVHSGQNKVLRDSINTLCIRPSKCQILSTLADTIALAVNAFSRTLYIYDKNTQDMYVYQENTDEFNQDETSTRIPVEIGTTVSAYVAATKETVRTSITNNDSRFPDGLPVEVQDVKFIFTHPVLDIDGELIGIIELYRKQENEEFQDEDEEISNSYLLWGGIALHYAELYTNMTRQKKLNNFLLTLVRSVFQDMVSMDTVIIKIMTFAQKLVDADRASLFLVDGNTNEMYARMFDVNKEMENANKTGDEGASKEIRFPVGSGIAGFVAQTGESLNIPDVYYDDRFNRSVDQLTGYTTKNLLCMPIFNRNKVIGVVQMVNKDSGPFTKLDEENFETFATYCGLALHHAKLYERIRRSQKKYMVALEMLSYHNVCSEEEVNFVKDKPIFQDFSKLKEFTFPSYSLDSDEKVKAAVYMFNDLFASQKYEQDCLIRFIITVRKNYRRVPYHNWTHGFSVANAMYAVLKSSQTIYKPIEQLALFVASLCHDLDHRGKTNQFLIQSESPLAAIYSTSILEHHHFNQAVSILQQDGHNILASLSSENYRKVLKNIKHCILATDLALFFPNKAKLKTLIDEDNFSWKNAEHRLLAEAICMTACDLCSSSKPWDQQQRTVKEISEEFYQQGDAERESGKEPIPMMDRTKLGQQPSSQVGFLKAICLPCYEVTVEVLPNTKPMLDGCLANLERWEAIVEEQKNEKEHTTDNVSE
ncbi:putative 3',5'-cyclic phosphodiesterase pde-5 [Tachypleus tridentatus]|uniref:putative 3',5'-cyclic phosphodiesterase pde-5 n=1 Tax=Tachypleus tridentatus TaxID=6853 RepID=UPI003FD2BBA5